MLLTVHLSDQVSVAARRQKWCMQSWEPIDFFSVKCKWNFAAGRRRRRRRARARCINRQLRNKVRNVLKRYRDKSLSWLASIVQVWNNVGWCIKWRCTLSGPPVGDNMRLVLLVSVFVVLRLHILAPRFFRPKNKCTDTYTVWCFKWITVHGGLYITHVLLRVIRKSQDAWLQLSWLHYFVVLLF